MLNCASVGAVRLYASGLVAASFNSDGTLDGDDLRETV